MSTITTIISYIFTGGIVALITMLATLKATKKSAIAEAMSKEEEAEHKSIENIERWRVAYANIIADLTEKLDNTLKKYNDLEQKYNGLAVKYDELYHKYILLQKKYETD